MRVTGTYRKAGDTYGVVDTDITWSKEALLQHLQRNHRNFLRMSYFVRSTRKYITQSLLHRRWRRNSLLLQLKGFFEEEKVPFPVLLVRNSVLLVSAKQRSKLENLRISPEALFLKRDAFINKKSKEISDVDIDLPPQKNIFRNSSGKCTNWQKKPIKTFLNAVRAQEKKQLKGLDKWRRGC